MKRQLPLILLLTCTIIAGIALGSIIKETKQGESIEFYTNESGTVEKTAELTPAGVLKVDNVQDLAGTGTPPGMVPIGGMVAVMPSTHANAWQPPATGAIKDGFMRADGHTITAQNVTDGSLFPESTVLPGMVDRFTRGTAATSGTVTGSDNIIPTGTNTLTAFAGAAATRADWFQSQSISATVKEHYHSMGGPGANLDVTALGTTNVTLAKTGGVYTHDFGTGNFTGSTDSAAAHEHNITLPSFGGYLQDQGGGGFGSVIARSGVGDSNANNPYNWKATPDGSHTHITYQAKSQFDHSHGDDIGGTTNIAHDHGLTGSIGDVTSGRNGDEDQALVFNANNNSMDDWAADGTNGTTATYTPSGTMTDPTFTGNSQTNMPVYTTVVWVIRVK